MQSNKPIALLKPVQTFCGRERRLENASGCHEFFTGCWKTVPIVWSDASTMSCRDVFRCRPSECLRKRRQVVAQVLASPMKKSTGKRKTEPSHISAAEQLRSSLTLCVVGADQKLPRVTKVAFCGREKRLENASGCHEFFTGCWKTVPIVWSDASTMRAYSAVGSVLNRLNVAAGTGPAWCNSSSYSSPHCAA
ncbi:hypothetical protein T12_7201 [Trichinella patagoniensis]|uniref:Uncharacterized protein n=1 Tax=Trichinella patagoniensis TaxID=990121 RepID=A0A0V1AB09_9BILA|nr:hypothetical protein T12_7201 [Trichinella patagoniensis]